MVEGQLAGGVFLSAVLAAVLVACEDVSAVELNFVSWEAVVKEQADDSRDGDV